MKLETGETQSSVVYACYRRKTNAYFVLLTVDCELVTRLQLFNMSTVKMLLSSSPELKETFF